MWISVRKLQSVQSFLFFSILVTFFHAFIGNICSFFTFLLIFLMNCPCVFNPWGAIGSINRVSYVQRSAKHRHSVAACLSAVLSAFPLTHHVCLCRCASCVKLIKKFLWGYFPQLPHKVLPTLSSLKSADEKNKRWGLLGFQILWSTFHIWWPSSFFNVTLHCLFLCTGPLSKACTHPQSHPSELLHTLLHLSISVFVSKMCLVL